MEWEEVSQLNPLSFRMGEQNVLKYFEQKLQGINYGELEKYPKETIEFIKSLEQEIINWRKKSSDSGDAIADEIATSHRGKPFLENDDFTKVAAPHIGVVWMAAEYFGDYITYWQAGHVCGNRSEILNFPPISKTYAYELMDELEIKVRRREMKLVDWWGKIKKLGKAIGILQLKQVDGIWEFHWDGRRSRQLFCQEDWFIKKLIRRIQLVASRDIEGKEVWTWLDMEEEKCAIRKIVSDRTISLIPQKLGYGAFKWRLSYKRVKTHIPRHRVWEIKNIIESGDLEKIERLRNA